MGHRTKINVSVDSHNELVIRGKLGEENYQIAQSLAEAVQNFKKQPSRHEVDAAQDFFIALDEVAPGIGLYHDFQDDVGMDVHVSMNFDSLTGEITIEYRPDYGVKFNGTFGDFTAEYDIFFDEP